MLFSPKEKRGFGPVAVGIILIGAGIFAYGLLTLLVNMMGEENFFFFPACKVMGGLIVMSLGYIILQLELIRHK